MGYSIHSYSSFLSFHSQLKHKPKLKANEEIWLFGGDEAPKRVTLQRQNVHLRTKAISNSPFFIGATTKIPPSQSGDITVFLQTSGLLLVVYFLANFVAPYFISKYFGFDKVGEDQNSTENDS